ncbi:hypothetical protein ACVDG5_005175 [Mesorhizobium sp. ORM6]
MAVAEEETPAPSPVGAETVLQAASPIKAARPAALSHVRLPKFAIWSVSILEAVMTA